MSRPNNERKPPKERRPWDITNEKMLAALTFAYAESKKTGVPLRQILEKLRDDAGKPTMVSVEFKETSNCWEGFLWAENDNQTPLYTYRMPKRLAGKPAEEWKPEKTDSLGIESAKVEYLKFAFPNSSPGREMEASSFDEFKSRFLKRTQGYILDAAASFGMLYMPSNFQREIINLESMGKLGKSLQKIPDKRRDMLAVKNYLLKNWREKELHKLDRKELAENIKTNLWINFKPNAAWKIVERLGLFSSRVPGPKPKS